MTSTHTTPVTDDAPVERWEYRDEVVEYKDLPTFIAHMNVMGREGWDLFMCAPISRGGSFRYAPGLTSHYQIIIKRRLR